MVTLYGKRLVDEGVISADEFDAMKAAYRKTLDDNFAVLEGYKANKADWLDGRWAGLKAAKDHEEPRKWRKGCARSEAQGDRPQAHQGAEDLQGSPHHAARARRAPQDDGGGCRPRLGDGGALAFGTLLMEGFPVRLSGQDVQRGTFSQRHAVLVDQDNEKRYTPLNHLVKDQQIKIDAINSMLSREAVLGFEYGYSLAEPNALTIWEAQFGDFANGAQVVFDQFISSGERKWLRMSGLVCLLPHGYEGQGPEHSSARLERYLQMCAEDNMQVANCTTPANYFHILRRQLKRDIRKPLIIMTPKSLLRHKRATVTLAMMDEGTTFHRLLWDDAEMQQGEAIKLAPDDKIKRVILCSGKVYYDLYDRSARSGASTTSTSSASEQLYPWPHKALINILSRFRQAEFVWCQEEPYNMGAWSFVQPNIERVLEFIGAKNSRPRYAGRPPSASTATGLMSRHLKELKTFLEEALGDSKA